MSNEYTVEQIFSAPIYSSKAGIDLKPYVNLFLKQKKEPNNSNTLGSLASQEHYILNKKQLKNVKNEILKHVYTYTKDILKYSNDFQISTSWLTFVDPGCSSHLHRHRNSMFSGIIYFQANRDSGDLVFEDKRIGDFFCKVSEYNILNSELWFYKPFTNKIIIFPSHLFHMIDTNNSDLKRISLAFNVIPIGKFGGGDSTLTIG